jgi:hypothetical protein
MNGHTRFAALIGFEADGRRFAHTGDQYFFFCGEQPFSDRRRLQNHVYRNGALLDGYDLSAAWMREWRPHIVLNGHEPPFVTDADFFRHVDEWPADYRGLHERAMPLGDDDTHFNLDSWGGWIWPYRTHIPEAGPVTVQVTVRNPCPHAAALALRLVGPAGWEGSETVLDAGPRAEVRCRMSITPAGPCRRQPFAVELTAGDRPFGQVAEALVTVGGPCF